MRSESFLSDISSVNKPRAVSMWETVIALVSVLTVSSLLVLTYGNIFAALACVVGVAVLIITLYRVEWGFCIFIGFVLLFDQFEVPGFPSVTTKISYFLNLKEIPYLPSFSAGDLNLLEAQLLLLVLVWFCVVCFRKNSHFMRVPMWGIALTFLFGVAGFVAYGLKRGGDFLPALWEVRALFYLGAMYFFVPQIIQTKGDLRALMWTCIVAISFKAFQGIERLARQGFSFAGSETLTNHEDPVFMCTLFIFLLALVVFNAKDRQVTALLLLLFPLFLGFFAGQRRAAYAALATSLIVFIVLIPPKERWVLAKGAVPFILCLAVYIAVFWNSESKIASPVKLVKTALSDDKATEGERYYSNLYRKFEFYDLAMTARYFPVFGIGFGNKYYQPVPLVKIRFPLRDYIPHDEDIWLVVKTGAVGYFLFWLFLDCFVGYGAMTLMKLSDPYLKAVCIMAILAVVGQITVSFYDLQLTYYRNMVYLGTLMGLVPSLEYIQSRMTPPAKVRKAA
ncbi:MAG TPA: O-antigen ligase family protein [Bacteroidota bacterium]|nr:O-antigen ligase family protein [Bacteroidota bacterium]